MNFNDKPLAFNTTFVVSDNMKAALISKGIDKNCCSYLSDRFGMDTNFIPDCIMPLTVPGDGNCALYSILSCITGKTKLQDFDLRKAVVQELKDEKEEYQKVFSKCETFKESVDSIISIAEKDKSFLGFAHFFVACNIIRRPIIVLSSQADHDKFGEGENGVEATFLPFMIRKEDCVSKFPILISWSSSVRNHFVPVCPLEKFVEKGDFSLIPRPAVAFWKGSERSEDQLLGEYLDFGEKLLYPPIFHEFEERFAELMKRKREEEKEEEEKRKERKMMKREIQEMIREEEESDYMSVYFNMAAKFFEEGINVTIRTGKDILEASFPINISPLETAKTICKDNNLPLENAKIISNDVVRVVRDHTYSIVCDSPIRTKSGISGSIKLGIPAVVPVRYLDLPSDKVIEECTSYFRSLNMVDYFGSVMNLSNIVRCLIGGSINVINKEVLDRAIGRDYKMFAEVLVNTLGWPGILKHPWYGK